MYPINIQEDLPAAKYCFCILPSIPLLTTFIIVKLTGINDFKHHSDTTQPPVFVTIF